MMRWMSTGGTVCRRRKVRICFGRLCDGPDGVSRGRVEGGREREIRARGGGAPAAAAAAEAARKAREEEERKAAEAARKTQEEAAKAMARQQTQNAQQAQQKNDKVQGSSQGQSSSSFGSNTTAKPQTVSNGQAVVNYAAQFVGNPYVYGGSSLTNGADCSGFVMSVYQAFGISLPHSSSALRSVGYGVSLDAIQPGDIVCYSGHVGIYAGNNTLLHASSPSTGIKYTSPVTYREILAIRRIF